MQILLSTTEIQTGVRRMARQIADHYGEQPITVLGIMTGSIVLIADLIRELPMPLQLGLVQTSSYGSGTERGPIRWNDAFLPSVAGRHTLLVDDIYDTGHTLALAHEWLSQRRPATIRTAVLLMKEGRQEVGLMPDYVGFRIPDLFVVGYGLDYCDQFRQLPYVAIYDPSHTM
jgi:hypoxanthine phosphoribosyltransferase